MFDTDTAGGGVLGRGWAGVLAGILAVIFVGSVGVGIRLFGEVQSGSAEDAEQLALLAELVRPSGTGTTPATPPADAPSAGPAEPQAAPAPPDPEPSPLRRPAPAEASVGTTAEPLAASSARPRSAPGPATAADPQALPAPFADPAQPGAATPATIAGIGGPPDGPPAVADTGLPGADMPVPGVSDMPPDDAGRPSVQAELGTPQADQVPPGQDDRAPQFPSLVAIAPLPWHGDPDAGTPMAGIAAPEAPSGGPGPDASAPADASRAEASAPPVMPDPAREDQASARTEERPSMDGGLVASAPPSPGMVTEPPGRAFQAGEVRSTDGDREAAAATAMPADEAERRSGPASEAIGGASSPLPDMSAREAASPAPERVEPPEDAAPPGPVQASPAPLGAAPNAAASPAVVAALIKRGQALFGQGDVSGARLLYRRAAEGGAGAAATALGKTYDRRFLIDIRAHGMLADAALAAEWYRRAAGSGDQEAKELLARLRAEEGR